MESRWEFLQDKWEKSKKTNADAFQEVKRGFDNALKDLKASFYNAHSKYFTDN